MKKMLMYSILGAGVITGTLVTFNKELITSVETSIDSLVEKVKGYDTNEKALVEKYNNLVSDTKSKIGRLNARITELENQLKDSETGKEELNEKITKLKEDLAKKNEELKALNEELEDLKKKLSDEEGKNTTLLEEVTRLQNEVNTANESLEELNDYINGKLQDINDNYTPVNVGSLPGIDEIEIPDVGGSNGSIIKENRFFSAEVRFMKNKVDITLNTKVPLNLSDSCSDDLKVVFLGRKDTAEGTKPFTIKTFDKNRGGYVSGENFKYYPATGFGGNNEYSNDLKLGEYYFVWNTITLTDSQFNQIADISIEIKSNNEKEILEFSKE